MGRPVHRFDPEILLTRLGDAGPGGKLWVAFSGGLDSTALLHALHVLRDRLPGPLRAVHANHGVHPRATDWQRHCAAVCTALDVPLTVIGPPTKPGLDGSPEEGLRTWRYGRLEGLLADGDLLCTAHHLDDQAETLLLALLRGSGPAGLAAMPPSRALGDGTLVRPLLDVPRRQLQDWLAQRGICWLEDPSNADLAPDRNYLRHEVLPRLRRRWPAVDQALATSARLCRETADQLDEAADLALAGREPAPGVLRLDGLVGDGPALRAVLRRWLRRHACVDLPRKRVDELERQLRSAATDRAIAVSWADHRLRHHRGLLWLDGPEAPPAVSSVQWPGTAPLPLGDTAGILLLESLSREAQEAAAGAAPADRPEEAVGAAEAAPLTPPLTIRYRQPGDRLRAAPERPSRRLKKWFSASPLPPWLRGFVPIVGGRETVSAVGDVVLDADLAQRLRRSGRQLCWQPANPGLAWAWDRCRASLLRLK